MNNTLGFRFAVYAPNGDLLGYLRDVSDISVSRSHNNLPSLRFSYPIMGYRSYLLTNPCEIAVEWNDNGIWREDYDSRFLVLTSEADQVDQSGLVTYTCPGYGYVLSKATVIKDPLSSNPDNQKRLFKDRSVGYIMQVLLNEAKARGNLPGLTFDFADTTDSAGDLWLVDDFTISYDRGQDYLSILTALSDSKRTDWHFDGRKLQLFNTNTELITPRANAKRIISSTTIDPGAFLLSTSSETVDYATGGHIVDDEAYTWRSAVLTVAQAGVPDLGDMNYEFKTGDWDSQAGRDVAVLHQLGENPVDLKTRGYGNFIAELTGRVRYVIVLPTIDENTRWIANQIMLARPGGAILQTGTNNGSWWEDYDSGMYHACRTLINHGLPMFVLDTFTDTLTSKDGEPVYGVIQDSYAYSKPFHSNLALYLSNYWHNTVFDENGAYGFKDLTDRPDWLIDSNWKIARVAQGASTLWVRISLHESYLGSTGRETAKDIILDRINAHGVPLGIKQVDSKQSTDPDAPPRDVEPVILRYKDVTEAMTTRSITDMASVVYSYGDDFSNEQIENTGAHLPWGPWEVVVGQGGVSDTQNLGSLAMQNIDTGAAAKVEITRRVPLIGQRWFPYRDYDPGDIVSVQQADGTYGEFQILQIVVSSAEDGYVADITMADAFESFDEKVVRSMRAANGTVGGTAQVGGAGTRPQANPADNRVPLAPDSITVTARRRVDLLGVDHALLDVSWSEVTECTNGSPATIGGYAIYLKLETEDEATQLALVRPEVLSTTVEITGATSDKNVHGTVSVVAIGTNARSSEPVVADPVYMLVDVDPPAVPTVPTVTALPGAIWVSWDGLLTDTIPDDFDRVDVHQGSSSTFTADDTNVVAYVIQAHRQVTITNLPLGEMVYFRLTSVDKRGNRSAATASVGVAPRAIGTDDLNDQVKTDIDTAVNTATTAQQTADAAQTTANTAQTTADGASTDAATAMQTAVKKSQIFRQTSAPTTGMGVGDLWFDTDDGNKAYWYNGSTWVVTQDGGIATAQTTADSATTAASNAQSTADSASTAASNAQSTADAASSAATAAQTTADGKNAVFRQTSAPPSTSRKLGDLWFDTDDGNKPYQWNGSAWVSAQDASIATAQTAADTASADAAAAQSTADAAASAASSAQSTADAAASAASTAQSAADAAQTTADGKNKIFRQTTAPTSGMVAGDLWFDTDDGNKPYTYSGSAWASAQDADIVTAQNTADSAMSTANTATILASGKNTIFYQSSQPTTGMKKGDTWFDTDDGYKIRTYSGSAWVLTQDSATALSTAQDAQNDATTAINNASTAQGTADSALTAANGKNKVTRSINDASGAGTTVGDLWYKIVSGSVVGMWQWDGSTWVEQTIDGVVVSNIDAGSITTGTLRADAIEANSITTSMLAIQSPDNLIDDPSFLNGIQLGATDNGVDQPPSDPSIQWVQWAPPNWWTIDPTGGRDGGPAAKRVHSDSVEYQLSSTTRFPVDTGSAIRVSFWVKSSVAATAGTVRLWVYGWDPTVSTEWDDAVFDPNSTQVIAPALAANTWTKVEQTIVIPDFHAINPTYTSITMAEVRIGIQYGSASYGTYWFSDVRATRATDASLIVDGTITADKLAANTITAGQIAAGTITGSNIKSRTITSGLLVAGTITSTEIAAGAITASTIGAGAVVTDKLGANAVTAAKIAAGTITATQIAAGTITADRLAAGSITSASGVIGSLDAGAITSGTLAAGRIATGSLNASVLVAGTITSGLLASNSVIAGKIAANAVTAGTIAANAVTAGKIAANAVTAGTVAAGAITAVKLGADVISGGTIVATLLDADTIQSKFLTAGKVNAADVLASGSITSASGVIGNLDAGDITVGTLTGISINGVTITGGTVTGSTMQTGSSGLRVKMSPTTAKGNGLAFFTQSNVENAWIYSNNSETIPVLRHEAQNGIVSILSTKDYPPATEGGPNQVMQDHLWIGERSGFQDIGFGLETSKAVTMSTSYDSINGLHPGISISADGALSLDGNMGVNVYGGITLSDGGNYDLSLDTTHISSVGGTGKLLFENGGWSVVQSPSTTKFSVTSTAITNYVDTTMDGQTKLYFGGTSNYMAYSSANNRLEVTGNPSNPESIALIGGVAMSAARITNGLTLGASGTTAALGNNGNRVTVGGAGMDINVASVKWALGSSTTNSANVFISSSGQGYTYYTTSLSKFKLDQQEIPLNYAILDLVGKTWIDKTLSEQIEGYDARTAGFVAEDVAALSAANGGAFDPLATKDTETNELNGVAYDRVVAYLIAVIKDMANRITALEAK